MLSHAVNIILNSQFANRELIQYRNENMLANLLSGFCFAGGSTKYIVLFIILFSVNIENTEYPIIFVMKKIINHEFRRIKTKIY